jgi:3-dehydroquinate dehydratase-2
MSGKVHILNGPNLSRLGTREPAVYGSTTLAELERLCDGWARALGLEATFAQREGEGELVELIHRAGDQADGLILNAAAYTHTSVAVRDAITSISIPVIEIHLSNPAAREPFRRQNLLEDVVYAGIRGFGVDGYRLALEGLAGRLRG